MTIRRTFGNIVASGNTVAVGRIQACTKARDGYGSGLSHVKQGLDTFDSGDHSGQNREHNFHPVTSLLYGATLYYLNLDQMSTLSSFAIATSD
jgi:hypothetical protein